MDCNDHHFYIRLKKAIRAAKMVQRQISSETGINEYTIREYTRGRIYPRAENMTLLCDCLNVSADYLFGLTENMNPVGRTGKCGFVMDRVEELMNGMGMTRTELGRKAGLAKDCMKNWVSGKHDMTYYSVKKIVQAYGVSADWLLGLSEKMYREGVEKCG